jgi:hypothetical protein
MVCGIQLVTIIDLWKLCASKKFEILQLSTSLVKRFLKAGDFPALNRTPEGLL